MVSFKLFFLIIPCLCLGLNESELAQLEMVTLLCMGDKTHSQLMEFMPEKCGSAAQSRDFEAVLSRVRYFEAAFPPYHLSIHEEWKYYFCMRPLLNNDITVSLRGIFCVDPITEVIVQWRVTSCHDPRLFLLLLFIKAIIPKHTCPFYHVYIPSAGVFIQGAKL